MLSRSHRLFLRILDDFFSLYRSFYSLWWWVITTQVVNDIIALPIWARGGYVTTPKLVVFFTMWFLVSVGGMFYLLACGVPINLFEGLPRANRVNVSRDSKVLMAVWTEDPKDRSIPARILNVLIVRSVTIFWTLFSIYGVMPKVAQWIEQQPGLEEAHPEWIWAFESVYMVAYYGLALYLNVTMALSLSAIWSEYTTVAEVEDQEPEGTKDGGETEELVKTTEK